MPYRLSFKRDINGIERFEVVHYDDSVSAITTHPATIVNVVARHSGAEDSKSKCCQKADSTDVNRPSSSDTQAYHVQPDDVSTDDVIAKDVSAVGISSDNMSTDDVPSDDTPSDEVQANDDVKDAAKEQILSALGFEEEEDEEDSCLGAEYGVAIELPEEDVVASKEETCCHGFRLVLGAILIYFVMAFYHTLSFEILFKLHREYLKEIPEKQMKEAIQGGGTDHDVHTMDSYFNTELSTKIYLHGFDDNHSVVTNISHVLDSRPDEREAVEDVYKINDIYITTLALLGLVSSTLVALFNYRKVILAGALINILALLAGTFVRDYKALIFLLGFCTALGNNLLFISITVALVERFRRHRTMAATLPGVVMTVGYLVALLLKTFVFGVFFMTSSKFYTVLLAVLYVLCLLAALLVKPRNLKMKNSGDTFRARALNVTGLKLFKAKGIYVLAALVFFYNYSKEVPLGNIVFIVPDSHAIYTDTAVFIGCFLSSAVIYVCTGGCCFCCRISRCCTGKDCCCRPCVRGCFKSITIHRLTIVLAVLCIAAGLNCIFVVGMEYHLAYIVAFSTILGIATGLADPLLITAIPTLLGERFTNLGVGATDFAKGLALVISREAAVPLVAGGNPKAIFYIGIATFIIGGALAVILNRLHHYELVLPMDSSQNKPDAQDIESDDVINLSDQSSNKEEV